MRALIVDDEASMARLLSRSLAEWGWTSDEASRVSSAIDSFKQRPYDLLLCDVDLPDGDGVSLARVLLQAQPTLAVIIVSGNPANLERAREAGLRACLQKPFTLSELQGLIGVECAEKR